MQVVIVGNGVAGMEAAARVRERRPSWTITVVSEESDHAFARTGLMYVLAGQLSYRDLEPAERDTYQRLRLVRVRRRAVGLDPDRRLLRLDDGAELPYDRLLLACGSAPRAPDWSRAEGLLGVGHFVTLQDLEWLEEELHDRPGVDAPPRARLHETDRPSPYRRRPSAAARRGRRTRIPAVVGGGLIGVEVVEAMVAAGLRPTFLLREEAFWPAALDPRESAWIAEALRAHGVDVRLGVTVRDLFGGDGVVTGLDTDQGPIDADLVVVAIGVVPHTGWLGEAVALGPEGGVRVDGRLRTSAAGVWAAGDCASVPRPGGSEGPETLWYTARDQGRVAGAQLAGDEAATYTRGMFYNSAKLMDVELTTVGQVGQGLPGEGDWFFEERGAVRSTTRLVHAEGRVVGLQFLGRRWDHSVCRRWIEEGRPLRWVVDRLGEASFDAELVPPLSIPASARPPP